METVPLLLPAILTERSNRRHGRAVPATFCAAYVAVFAVAVVVIPVAGLVPMSRLAGQAEDVSGGAILVVVMGFYGLCVLAGLTVAFFVVSPFVRRWGHRAASGEGISAHF